MQTIKISDTTLIGNWEEVSRIPAYQITKNENDNRTLDGIILRGYETKFSDGVNENGEKYSKDCIDEFIQRYFVQKKLNMPVDIEHSHAPEWLAGRVLYLESNNIGFYFVIYIPRNYMHYDHVLNLLKEGVLQGFSKEGYAEGELVKEKDGSTYFLIKTMNIVRVSLVSTPANGQQFEKMTQTRNELNFVNKKQKQSLYRPKYNPNK